MNTKLTLNISKKIIRKAKQYSRMHQKSLSKIVEEYLDSISRDSKKDSSKPIAPVTKSLIGIIKVPKNLDSQKEINEFLENKYLKQ